jgi:cytochrome c biogenesis factor
MFFDIGHGTSQAATVWAVMADEGYYRREAERCRELAASAPDTKTARRWHKIADQYAVMAEQLDAHIHHRTPILRAQPAQQQQSKAKQAR